MYGIPLHHISFTHSTMHIYPGKMSPHLTIDFWNTTTLHEFNIEASGGQEVYDIRSSWHSDMFTWPVPIRWAAPSIYHRCVEYHYTHKFHISHNAHLPRADVPPFDHRSMEYHYTAWVSHRGIWWARGVLSQVMLTFLHFQMSCTHQMSWTPPPINHRCVEYHYTK